MHILIADLHEYRSAGRQQIPRHGQAVAQIGEIAVDAIGPSVAERLHLFGFAAEMIGLAVLHIAAGGAPLKIAVEFDPVRRVDIDALHLTLQPLPLRQARHDFQAIAQDHAVRPMLIMRIKFGALIGRDAIEIREQIRRILWLCPPLACAFQILDNRLGVDFLLNIQWRRLNDQVRPIRHVLPPPHQLRIKIRIAPLIRHPDGSLHLRRHERLQLRRRRIAARGLIMSQGFDGQGFFGH